MGNDDEGTGSDADECGCAYTNPIEKALGDQAFVRVEDDIERTTGAILMSDRPHEFAAQLREARGYRAAEPVA